MSPENFIKYLIVIIFIGMFIKICYIILKYLVIILLYFTLCDMKWDLWKNGLQNIEPNRKSSNYELRKNSKFQEITKQHKRFNKWTGCNFILHSTNEQT